jgi:N6-L-threonylcarbamoyladenine synthase
LLGGGVCCNKRLQEMSKIMCKERNAQCFIPKNDLLVDNGAMIAWLGVVEFKKRGATKLKNSQILPYWRTDQV